MSFGRACSETSSTFTTGGATYQWSETFSLRRMKSQSMMRPEKSSKKPDGGRSDDVDCRGLRAIDNVATSDAGHSYVHAHLGDLYLLMREGGKQGRVDSVRMK